MYNSNNIIIIINFKKIANECLIYFNYIIVVICDFGAIC